MLRGCGIGFAFMAITGLAGCGPMTFESPTYYKKSVSAMKPLATFEPTTSAHSRKQKIVVQLRTGGVPVDVCAIYDMPNRTKEARDGIKRGEVPLDHLAYASKEADPVLKFELPAKHPLRVIVFNSSDRTPDVEVEIKTE